MILRCLLVLAALFAAPAPASAGVVTPIVIGQSYGLDSRVMGSVRTINVYLPPSYAKDDKARFPVLYLLDGGTDQDFHHITGLIQLGSVAATTREVIVVGIVTEDRRNELAFAPKDAKLKADYPTAGGSERFRRFIAEEVKPWVAARYRTDGDDGLMGESLAGLFVVETMLRTPDLFDRYIAVSPSLWWDDERLNQEAGALLKALDAKPRWLWLSVADEKGMGVDGLAARLGSDAPKSLHWTFAPMRHETHATIYHGAALAAIRSLYALPSS